MKINKNNNDDLDKQDKISFALYAVTTISIISSIPFLKNIYINDEEILKFVKIVAYASPILTLIGGAYYYKEKGKTR